MHTATQTSSKKCGHAKCDRRNVRPGSAQDLRIQAAERAALIARLGMAPEDGTAAGRYAAAAGELRRWVHEDFGVEAAEGAARGACAKAVRS